MRGEDGRHPFSVVRIGRSAAWCSSQAVACGGVSSRSRGCLPQHNTLDRSITVWENLYLHCQLLWALIRELRAIRTSRAC